MKLGAEGESTGRNLEEARRVLSVDTIGQQQAKMGLASYRQELLDRLFNGEVKVVSEKQPKKSSG